MFTQCCPVFSPQDELVVVNELLFGKLYQAVLTVKDQDIHSIHTGKVFLFSFYFLVSSFNLNFILLVHNAFPSYSEHC